MTSGNSRLTTIEDLHRGQAERRLKQAALPIEEKVEILVRLQTINAQLARQKGRPVHEPWKIQRREYK